MAHSSSGLCPNLHQLKMKKVRAHSDLNQGPIGLQPIALPLSYRPRSTKVLLNWATIRLVRRILKTLSEVGFEPTPSYEDQNSHLRNLSESKVNLESGALDHSAILTLCFSLN